MDIRSKGGYPSSSLSNFAPHAFVFDGVECASMEGLVQAFKYSNEDMQVEVCKLVGLAAKNKGRNKDWKAKQTLYWKGVEYKRESDEYQKLLDRAYDALYTNEKFMNALIHAGDAVFTHTMGRAEEKETVLTRSEFCSRITKLRDRAKKEIADKTKPKA